LGAGGKKHAMRGGKPQLELVRAWGESSTRRAKNRFERPKNFEEAYCRCLPPEPLETIGRLAKFTHAYELKGEGIKGFPRSNVFDNQGEEGKPSLVNVRHIFRSGTRFNTKGQGEKEEGGGKKILGVPSTDIARRRSHKKQS